MQYRIFISFTNYHNYCINDIINQEDGIINVVITNSNFTIQNIPFLHIHKIGSLFTFLQNIFLRKNKNKIAQFLINEIEQKDTPIEQIEIVIPHYNNIMANYIMKFIQNNYKNTKHKVKIIKSIYPDGLAMFYPTELEYDKFLLKYIISYFVGMPMRYLKSKDMLNPFKEIDLYYSYIPEITYNPYNLSIKKIDAKKDKITGSNILILGYGTNNFHDTFIEDFISEVGKKIEKTNGKIYYKSHPSINRINDIIFNKFKNKFDVSYINSAEPIEVLLKDLKATHVFSLASSSLINLKMIYEEQIDCYYFGIENLIQPDLQPYFEKMFAYTNVKKLGKNDQ